MPIFATNTGTFSPLSVKGIHATGSVSEYLIGNSLKFDKDADSTLTRSITTTGNQTKFTLSCWVKPSHDYDYTYLIGVSSSFSLYWTSSQKLHAEMYSPDGSTWAVISDTQAIFPDVTSWYHVVATVDSSAGTTNADRFKIWVNGVQQTIDFTTYWAGLIDGPIKHLNESGQTHQINSRPGATYHSSFYLAEYHYLDGISVTSPTAFGEFDATTGVWTPIEYTGSYEWFDNSQTWSSATFFNDNGHDFYNSGSAAQLFDNVESGSGSGGDFPLPVDGGTFTLTFTQFSSAQSVELEVEGTGNALKINGSFVTIPSGSPAAATYSVSGLTTIEWLYNGGSNYCYLGSIKVDGKKLIDQSVSVGNNSFHLNFSNSSDVGEDQAGSNDFTASGIASSDIMKDSPSSGDPSTDTGLGGELVSGYSVLNPLASGSSTTLSNGNLTMTSGATWQSCLSTFSFVGGKWYYEVTTVNNQYSYVGISRSNHNYQVEYPSKNKSWAMVNDGTCYYDQIGSDAITVNTGTSVGANGTIGVAIDADNGKIWWAINGTWLNSGNPATGANPIFTNVPSDEELVACMDVYSNTGTANFGATPFNYQAPSGFKTLCTANSTTSTVVDGSAAMDTVVYDSVGTGGGLSVSSLQFQPDLLIFKDMDGGNNWVWFDSLRRLGYKLDSSSTNGQTDFTSYFTSIDSNGFTIPAGNHDINRDTNTIAAYCWNAGELAVSSDTTNYDQSQEWSANITPGFGGERIYDGSTITYADSSTTGGATLFSGTMTIPAGQDLQIRTQNGGASSITVDGNAVSTASGQVTTTLVSGPATVNTITAPTGFNIYYFTIGGKQLIDPGVITIGSFNSSVYDQSQNFSGNTSNPTGSYGNASNAFDGNLSTHASPSYGNEMTYTNPSPSSHVIDTFEIYIDIYNTGVTVELNGTSIVSQLTTTENWYTISGFEGQNFSTLKWGPTSGNLEARLKVVKVNGKILIDQGVTVPTNVPSLPAKVKRSPEYGFSMVKYFGDGNADVTVPHNLGKTPTFYIEKNASATGNWGVLTNVIDGSMDFLYLNSNNSAKGDASQAQFTEQTFNVQTPANQNLLNNEYIQYIWTDIPGYSKAGVYTGSGGQQFVHLGFRPAWLLIKRYSDTTVGEWSVYNSTRSPNNEVQRKVWFNNISGEEDHPNNSLAFTANGFIVDPGSDAPNVQYTNNTNIGYLYLAFAGNPFSNSTAF
jgi:hypothetical protein